MKKTVGFLLAAVLLGTACNQPNNTSQIPAPTEPVAPEEQPAKPVVYFTRDISPEGLVKIYDKINQNIEGKVAIKLHTGEPHGPNILPRPMVKALLEHIPNSRLVETNTLYAGGRDTTEKHRETLKINGWTEFADVDILDEEPFCYR